MTRIAEFSIPGPSVGLLTGTVERTGRVVIAPESQRWMAEIGKSTRFTIGRDIPLDCPLTLVVVCNARPSDELVEKWAATGMPSGDHPPAGEQPDLVGVIGGIAAALEQSGIIRHGGQFYRIEASKQFVLGYDSTDIAISRP